MRLPLSLEGSPLRVLLLSLLGSKASLKSSYLPGRSGFVATSGRELRHLRSLLVPYWMCRIYALDRAHGRYFLEPSKAYLRRALEVDTSLTWWTDAHQAGAFAYFTALRSERLRRLSSLTYHKKLPAPDLRLAARGYLFQRALALRLEALPHTNRPLRHWQGIGESFDRLWAKVPLYKLGYDPLWAAVIAQLLHCQDTYSVHQKDPKKNFV